MSEVHVSSDTLRATAAPYPEQSLLAGHRDAAAQPAADVGAHDGRPHLTLAAQPPRVGFLSGGDEKGAESFVAAMLDGLQAEGYSEPATITLDRLYADYTMDKVPSLVAELQHRGVDIIVTHAAATPIVVHESMTRRGWFRSSMSSARTRSLLG
jgi:hypothetical protein